MSTSEMLASVSSVQSVPEVMPPSRLLAEPLDAQALESLTQAICGEPRQRREILEELQTLIDSLQNGAKDPATALRVAVGLHLMGRRHEALVYYQQSLPDRAVRHYQQGICHRELGQYDAALASLAKAAELGWPAAACLAETAETHRLAGHWGQLEQLLESAETAFRATADWFCYRGAWLEYQGQHEAALEHFTKALQLAPNHRRTLFSLAYLLDLRGEEREAIRLYRLCVAQPPPHPQAMLNLALLLEEAGEFQQAIEMLDAVLEIQPDHPRATLYRKDALASTTMYFDELEEKRRGERNQVLEIPVTDFELSVRSRNCLKKMNIRTLGDLLNTTEAELLSYKNFGETSLAEIKEMLTAKGLRLGQNLDETAPTPAPRTRPKPVAANPVEGILATAVNDIEFSVRSKKCLNRLGVTTLADLCSRTEQELLSIKNFGQTSLQEIKNKLAEYNLGLRVVK